jgi:hypothetical protein
LPPASTPSSKVQRESAQLLSMQTVENRPVRQNAWETALGTVRRLFLLLDLQADHLPKLQVIYLFGSLKFRLMHSFANG